MTLGLALVLAAAALTACEPPPERLVLTVDTTEDTSGAGDGACQAGDAGDRCTLPVALSLANAAPDGADIILPAGTYIPGSIEKITGDVRINWGASQDVLMRAFFIIEAGGRLSARGLTALPGRVQALTFNVSGRLDLQESLAAHITQVSANGPPAGPITVRAGGVAVLADSSSYGLTPVENQGVLLAVRSTIQVATGVPDTVPAVNTAAGGTTLLQSSALVRVPGDGDPGPICSGTPPQSLGYVHLHAPCGGVVAPTDSSGTITVALVGGGPTTWFAPTSPLVDRVPVGVAGCAPDRVDQVGTSRALDGNGDLVVGCDIGAFELQP